MSLNSISLSFLGIGGKALVWVSEWQVDAKALLNSRDGRCLSYYCIVYISERRKDEIILLLLIASYVTQSEVAVGIVS